MADRFQPRLIPPSIRDARTQAFGELIKPALADPDFRALLFERIDDVDARVLPYLVREMGVQHFVQPGMSEIVVRRLLKGSFELHRQTGYITGVRTGLAMLGVSVTSWTQWFQASPPAAPGTHVATVSVADEVFAGEGRAITSRLQQTIGRMVERMQRKSQFVAVRIVTNDPAADSSARAPVHVGAAVITRLRISPSLEPITSLTARPPLYVGAAVSSRIRIAPRIT